MKEERTDRRNQWRNPRAFDEASWESLIARASSKTAGITKFGPADHTDDDALPVIVCTPAHQRQSITNVIVIPPHSLDLYRSFAP